MNKAYLMVGGNLGDRLLHLETARSLINQYCGHIINASSIYETGAWGNTEQPPFLNQALEIETQYNAMQLVRRILRTEKNMGRERKEKYGPRVIDIDIIFFNDDQFNYPFLQVPHPEMHKRRFVLVPLSEIAPDAKHNVLGKTVRELLEECDDQLQVNRFTG